MPSLLSAFSDAQFHELIALLNNLIASLPKILESGGMALAAAFTGWTAYQTMRNKSAISATGRAVEAVSVKADQIHAQGNGALAAFKAATEQAVTEATADHAAKIAQYEPLIASERHASQAAAALAAAALAERTPDLSDAASPREVVIVNPEAVPVSVVPPEPEPNPKA